MGGSSLWLIPASDDNPFNKCLQDLIGSTLPSNFTDAPKIPFTPHVTLTSDIDPSKTYTQSSPKSWLDNLSLPGEFQKEKNEVVIELEALEADSAFFKKVTLRAAKPANLLHLASTLREQAIPELSGPDAKAWAETAFLPHLSLFYGDVPVSEVKKKIPLIELQLGFELGSLFDCCGGTLAMGARLVLVETSRDIKDWTVIAERQLPWVMWKMARGLL